MRADAAPTEIMPAVVRLPRWSHWTGRSPLSAVAKRRPGRTNLPGRRPEPIPGLYPNPDEDLLARVLRGLRAL
ncbi:MULTISPECIES: hypothetical protein [unclassified Actinopolyspora]|uniref:hypothetical protein n=1 Tax=unclassified Actinopolyspora TaxID=2639451 RepID=UPI0013F68843|nr:MULTISPECIES: hypothetical protein [unclassified Actinopolyspora]NHD18557.1 hypothetical protein [Actinopolyspora sp. BKK2]NHE77484.1 hypothetical protein [Actinopolyspora sp. BKK1]